MSGYAGPRRRAGRRIGIPDRPDRRMVASGHRRGRNLDGPTWVPGLSRGDLTMARDRDRSRGDRITVEDLDPNRVGLTMARDRDRSRGDRTTVEDLGRSRAGPTMAQDRDRSRGDQITVEDLDPSRTGLTMARERDLNQVGRVTARRPNPGNRMVDRDRNRRGLTLAHDRSRAGRVVEDPRMGRRVSARVVPIRGLRAPTGPTNVSHRLSRSPAH